MIRVMLFVGLCVATAIPVVAGDGMSGTGATNAVEKTPPAETRLPAGDPFAMRGVADGEGFVSAAPAAIPPGIRVAGILVVAGKPPVGALSIPGSKTLHYVREGEVIEVDRPAGGEGQGMTASQLYLLVKSITPSQIEIAPRTRPQDVRIYR
jgi:hypothetical protein